MSKRTEISTLGRFGLLERLGALFSPAPTGEDAAAVGDKLFNTSLLLEGIHFDLSYFPLRHLGYKAVTASVSSICAMNGRARHIALSLGVSARLSVEQLEELNAGVARGCEDYDITLISSDITSSLTGLTIAVTAQGEAAPERIVHRSGARENDLICITGDLGAAYMGLQLLERERRVLEGHRDPKPQFEGYEYLLERQLRPRARQDVVELMADNRLKPGAMTLIRDGLASDMLQICKASGCGARIYLERLPINAQTHRMAEELHADPVVAALNGGEDYELLFTVPLAEQAKIADVGGIDVIGHITAQGTGAQLITPDGGEINLTAPGWTALK